LESFALEPFLCITVISPIFQSFGIVAVSTDNLNRRVSGATISFLTSNRSKSRARYDRFSKDMGNVKSKKRSAIS